MTSSITPLWNQMTKNRFNLVFFVAFFFLALTGYSQEAKKINSAKVQPVVKTNSVGRITSSDMAALPNAETKTSSESLSVLEHFKGKKEDLSKRDVYSKHYINADGSRTALIGIGPMHYQKNGTYQEIINDISFNADQNYTRANKTNLFESYFGATSHIGVKNKTNVSELKEFLDTKMYWEANGSKVNVRASANVAVTTEGNKAFYNNLYGSIAAEFTIESGRRKLNYIIPNASALQNAPAGADYLVFSENVLLPHGWTYSISQRHGILISDQNGKIIYNYENPVSTDAASDLYTDNTIYNVSNNNNVLTIETKVKASWILDTSRQFPIQVDPTNSYFPNASTHRTGQLLANGQGAYGNYAVGYSGGFYRSYVSFDVTGIPDSATINTTVLYHNVGATTGMTAGTFGSEIRSFLTDPESASYPNWIDVYNAVVNATNSPTLYVTVSNLNTTGSKNVTLGTTANTHLKNALIADKFTVSYRPAGSYTTTPARYAQFYGESDATRKPYLSVTYTEAAVCSGTPTGGTAALTPTSGTFGSTFTANVTGATSGVSGLTYQWESAPTATGPWTDISGATLATSTVITAVSATTTTYYRRKITCSGVSSYSTVVSYTTACNGGSLEGNCAAVGDCGYVGILNVKSGTINNTSGFATVAPGYTNYTAQSTDVSEGNSYTIEVTYRDTGAPVNPGVIGAWIDWNGDNIFSGASEYLGSFSNVLNNQISTFTFSVPAGTVPGSKKVRIRSAFDEPLGANNGCTITDYGETEDYSVNVLSLAGLPNNIVFHNTGGTQQLAFNNSRSSTTTPTFRMSHGIDTATDYQIEINDAANFSGTAWTQTLSGSFPLNTEENFTFNNGFTPVDQTTYYVRVRVRGSVGTYSPWTTQTYSFTYDSTNTTPNWFQTTQAQFATATHSGSVANSVGDIVSGPGGNLLVNGDFSNGVTGWTTSKSYSAATNARVGANDGCTNCSPAANNFKMGYPWSTSAVLNTDYIILAQTVDLTNVNEIKFNIGKFRSLGGLGTANNLAMYFVIGGTTANETGTTEYTNNLNANGSFNEVPLPLIQLHIQVYKQ